MSKVSSFNSRKGFTLIEVIVVTSIISVLAAIAVPIAKKSYKRKKELELRRSLRVIRTAIDEYHQFTIKNKINVDSESYNYPAKLEVLVEGIKYKDKNKDKIKKFLRRIPKNPFGDEGWGLRSYQDKYDSTSWGGQNVFDVYCTSEAKSLDGTFYKDW